MPRIPRAGNYCPHCPHEVQDHPRRNRYADALEDQLPPEPTPEQQRIDVGKRASEAINLHMIAGNIGKWVALRLIDGGSDGIPYDTRRDAIAHQLHEQLCCYIRVTPDGITPENAVRFIEINRALYDAGYRLADPGMPGEPIYPERVEEVNEWLRGRRQLN